MGGFGGFGWLFVGFWPPHPLSSAFHFFYFYSRSERGPWDVVLGISFSEGFLGPRPSESTRVAPALRKGIEQQWTMSHGLPGLVDAPMQCPGDQDALPNFMWEFEGDR